VRSGAGHRPRVGRAHSAAGDRVRRPTCEASVRRRLLFLRRDGEGRTLYLGLQQNGPARPRRSGSTGHAKAGGGLEHSQGCGGDGVLHTHLWPTWTASCGLSASTWPSASAIRMRFCTRTSRISYWSPLGSPLCACAPARPQMCCHSVHEAFRAAWGRGGSRLRGGVFALAYALLRPASWRRRTPRAFSFWSAE